MQVPRQHMNLLEMRYLIWKMVKVWKDGEHCFMTLVIARLAKVSSRTSVLPHRIPEVNSQIDGLHLL